MTKIVLITDTHWGVRNDNQVFYSYYEKFFSQIFFPYIDSNSIKHVVHLGDVVDRRKFINFMTARKLHDVMMKPLFDRELDVHIILGNHDVHYKDTNEVNCMRELYGTSTFLERMRVYERPEVVDLAGLEVVMMPWICAGTHDESIEVMASTKAQVLMGHLELNGFEMDRGHIQEHGMDKSPFDKFDVVMSGHYHHKSSHGNIHYLGAFAQQTWADYDDPKGFHVFDTETRKLEFVENPFQIFKKFLYDDQSGLVTVDPSRFSGAYTKVIVKNKTDPYMFDRVISSIEGSGVVDLQIVEDHLNLDMIDDEDLVDEAQDTMSILLKSVNQIDTSVDKKRIERFVQDLYQEALSVE